MNVLAMSLAYMSIWLVLNIINTLKDRHQRGHIWWLLKKFPPWRNIKIPFFRWMFLWGICVWAMIVTDVFAKNEGLPILVFWLPQIVIEIDDYFGRNEDRWKRFKAWAKNKIKWRTFAPSPVKAKEVS